MVSSMPTTFSLSPAHYDALIKLLDAAAVHGGSSPPKFKIMSGVSASNWKRWNHQRAAGENVGIASENLDKIAALLRMGDAERLYSELASRLGHPKSGAALRHENQEELKSVVDGHDLAFSECLLDVDREPPSFADTLRRLKSKSLTDAEKDAGMIGEPPYTHIVQLALAVTLHASRSVTLLCSYRKRLSDPDGAIRTLGGSALFSQPMIHNHKNYSRILGDWLQVLDEDSLRAEQLLLKGYGSVLPVPLQMFAERIRMPRLVKQVEVIPAWVVTNNQRDVVRHDGRVMRTVYTSYVFHVKVHMLQSAPLDVADFGSPDYPREMYGLDLSLPDAEYRRVLSNSKGSADLVNGMDYLVALAAQGRTVPKPFRAPNGLVTLRNRFLIS
jgi:ribosomal protein L39E